MHGSSWGEHACFCDSPLRRLCISHFAFQTLFFENDAGIVGSQPLEITGAAIWPQTPALSWRQVQVSSLEFLNIINLKLSSFGLCPDRCTLDTGPLSAHGPLLYAYCFSGVHRTQCKLATYANAHGDTLLCAKRSSSGQSPAYSCVYGPFGFRPRRSLAQTCGPNPWCSNKAKSIFQTWFPHCAPSHYRMAGFGAAQLANPVLYHYHIWQKPAAERHRDRGRRGRTRQGQLTASLPSHAAGARKAGAGWWVLRGGTLFQPVRANTAALSPLPLGALRTH